MKAVGIVVEYNPFHNGHLFHLEQARKVANADVVIAVMSGPFLQRGEPALLPKWTRAKMALHAGVDLVLELPYQFAVQHANRFAFGAVSILAHAGCESLCFGSEAGTIHSFYNTYHFLKKNEKDFQQTVKLHLDRGVNYPTALSLAFAEIQPPQGAVDLSQPNNILGFQYVKAILDEQLPIEPFTITRTGANYHDDSFTSTTIASATSIRKTLFSVNGDTQTILPFVPSTTAQLLDEYIGQFEQLHQWENYWPYLKFRLLQASPEELRTIYEVEEGLENRIIRSALHADSFQHFIEQLKTKRYTWTRLQRICIHILTNTKKSEMEKRMNTTSYIRLLGMNENGRNYLNKWKSHLDIPLISTISTFQKEDITLDVRAARIYALGAKNEKRNTLLQMEYKQPPIYLRDI